MTCTLVGTPDREPNRRPVLTTTITGNTATSGNSSTITFVFPTPYWVATKSGRVPEIFDGNTIEGEIEETE